MAADKGQLSNVPDILKAWRVTGLVDTSDSFDWPNWSTWALLAIVITASATIAATLNDIW